MRVKEQSLTKTVKLGTIAGFISMFVLMVCNLIETAVVIRYLSKQEAGIWFLCLSLITFLAFCDFGLSPTLSREIGFSSKKINKVIRLNHLLGTIKVITQSLSILLAICLFIFYQVYLQHSNLPSHFAWGFLVFAIAIIIRFQANPNMAAIYGIGHVAITKTIQAVAYFLGVLCSCTLVFFNYKLWSLSIGYLVNVTILFGLSYWARHNSIPIKKLRFNKLVLKKILSPCLQWTVMTVGALLIFQLSNFMIALLLGSESVPAFSVIKTLSVAVLFITSVVNLITTPFISRAAGLNNWNAVRHFFGLNVRVTTAVALVCCIIIVVFNQSISFLWLGKNNSFNQLGLLYLMITTVLEAHHVACAQVAMAAGYVRFAVIALLGGILNVVLSLFFIKLFGVAGAALAILISQLFTNNWYVVFVSIKYINYNSKMYWVDNFKLLLFGFIITGVCMVLNQELALDNIWLTLIAKLFLATAVSFWLFNFIVEPYKHIVSKIKLLNFELSSL